MDFEQLTLNDWQQFAEIDISFHPRATILTGANGSGKTTILSLLARHRGWHQQALATPKNDFITKGLKYFSLFRVSSQKASSDRSIGALRYSNGSSATIIVPEAATAQYEVTISNQQHARFFYIPSHRQTFGGFKPEVQHLQPSKVRRCHHLVRPRPINNFSLKSASPLPV